MEKLVVYIEKDNFNFLLINCNKCGLNKTKIDNNSNLEKIELKKFKTKEFRNKFQNIIIV